VYRRDIFLDERIALMARMILASLDCTDMSWLVSNRVRESEVATRRKSARGDGMREVMVTYVRY